MATRYLNRATPYKVSTRSNMRTVLPFLTATLMPALFAVATPLPTETRLTVRQEPQGATPPTTQCQQAFYTQGNAVLKTCNTDVNTATMYLIRQISAFQPDYVKVQCRPYCAYGSSAPSPSSFTPSSACQQALAPAASKVKTACGSDAAVNAAADYLFTVTARDNLGFVQKQCASYCPSSVRPASDLK